MARVPVLMYHRVGAPLGAADSTYCITPERFRAHMQALARAGYRTLSSEGFVAWLEGAALPPAARPFVLTFDDGFADVFTHALPVLREFDYTATVFLVAGLVGEHDRWMQSPGVQRPLVPLLSLPQIERMSREGWHFHSHSMRHRSLTALDGVTLADEIDGSRTRLRELLGTSVELFAYPYGHHDSQVVTAVKAAGYRAAFSVQPGFNRRDVDRYRIRRLDVFGQDTSRTLLRKIAFGSNDGSPAAVCRYYWSRLRRRAG